MYRSIPAYPFIRVLSLVLPCIIILLLHLLSTNHKCTQPCYFPLLLKPTTQTRLSFLWRYGAFRCSFPLRIVIVFRDTICVIIITPYS
jgi:hypothetical protein